MAVKGDEKLSEAQKKMIKILLSNFEKKPKPVDPEKLIPVEIKQKIANEIRNEKWTGGVDWAVERRR